MQCNPRRQPGDCWPYNRQHGTRCLGAIANNLYGPGDNYDLKTSRMLPALIAKLRHEDRVVA